MYSFKQCLWLFLAGLGAVSAGAAPYNRLYVFGDSYSDIGAGYIDSNGPTAVAYLGWHMGLDFTHAKAAKAADKSLDFAVSGARTGEGEGRKTKDALLGYGMMNQVKDFVARVKAGDPLRSRNHHSLSPAELNDGRLPTETTIANHSRRLGF